MLYVTSRSWFSFLFFILIEYYQNKHKWNISLKIILFHWAHVHTSDKSNFFLARRIPLSSLGADSLFQCDSTESLMHLLFSGFDVVVEMCRNVIWVTFQTTSKCGLDLICKNFISCVLLTSRLPKIYLDTIWRSQNFLKRLGLAVLNTACVSQWASILEPSPLNGMQLSLMLLITPVILQLRQAKLSAVEKELLCMLAYFHTVVLNRAIINVIHYTCPFRSIVDKPFTM